MEDKMRGGYKGYYNGMALDSSYEYIYCRILDKKGINYKVHEKTYQLSDRQYTPDFFIYNSNEDLIEIVEIRGYRLNIQERIRDVSELSEILGLKVTLITEKTLEVMCNELSLSYFDLMTEWIDSPDTIRNLNKGEFNAMWNVEQSCSAKQLIGDKARERMKDTEYRNNIVNALVASNRANGFYYAKLPRSKRVEVTCRYCGKKEVVTEAVAKNYKVCSQQCVVSEGYGLSKCREVVARKKEESSNELRLFILDYLSQYAEYIKTVKLNKITTDSVLNTMLDIIKEKYGVFDMRTICEATCGIHGRKNFVLWLRENL